MYIGSSKYHCNCFYYSLITGLDWSSSFSNIACERPQTVTCCFHSSVHPLQFCCIHLARVLSNLLCHRTRSVYIYTLSSLLSDNLVENYRVIQKLNSLPSSIDFTSLKRFHKSLAPKCYSHSARYFLFSCMCCVFILCFVFDIHVYFKVSLHVFHACQCKWPIGPFV